MPSAFLWGGAGTAPDVEGFHPRRDDWWRQYQEQLRGGHSPAALAELRRACRTIVGLLPDPQAWSDRPRPARGLVVGSVQSGKTASMIGVAATAIDHGFRVIVVLAGGQDDLRQQTARRFNRQLLLQSDAVPQGSGARTMAPCPRPLGGFGLPYATDAHNFDLLHIKLLQALERGEPVVLVVKKHVASLQAVRGHLLTAYRRYGAEAVPTLVLDDECDEASVDSAEMPIPTAIADLWHGGQARPAIAYVGYTATAAANLLQHPENDLFPADFVVLLRTPGEDESPLTFADPDPDRWYTGGDCFTTAFGDAPGEDESFLISPSVEEAHLALPPAENPSLRDAVRAYLIAGAYRLALTPELSLRGADKNPPPHTMLVQTSPVKAEHRVWAKGLADMFGGVPRLDRGIPLSSSKVDVDLAESEPAWRRWYDAFRRSRERVYTERPHAAPQRHATWEQVRARLADVIAATCIRVVNSDDELRASLDFSPRIAPDGGQLPPRDLFTIVIGGAKLSRGLTIEGLCISYFARWSATPTEDTVLQLSRWFGYRGRHLEFCRLVTTPAIAAELRGMTENDAALRLQLADLMASRTPPRQAAVVIAANARALPTSKLGVGVLRDVAFSPETKVFRHLEVGTLMPQNTVVALELVAAIRQRGGAPVKSDTGATRGLLSRGWSAEEVAAWLDKLQFGDHNPDHSGNAARDHYRRPDRTRPISLRCRFDEDPYQVAAYLREWVQRANDVGEPPCFNVGVAYGEMREAITPFDFPLLNREVSATGQLQSGWTGRSSSWRGDAFFDGPSDAELIPGSSMRRQGAAGLLLLYVIHKDAGGKRGVGPTRTDHAPTFGIVIPAGGPAFRRIVADHRSRPALAAAASPDVAPERAGPLASGAAKALPAFADEAT